MARELLQQILELLDRHSAAVHAEKIAALDAARAIMIGEERCPRATSKPSQQAARQIQR